MGQTKKRKEKKLLNISTIHLRRKIRKEAGDGVGSAERKGFKISYYSQRLFTTLQLPSPVCFPVSPLISSAPKQDKVASWAVRPQRLLHRHRKTHLL